MHIAEVGLRVKDLAGVVAFYQNVLGLELVHSSPNFVFMKAGDLDSPLGRGGHPQYLVLFDRDVALDVTLSTLDHLAFEIPLEQFDSERARLEAMGLLERVRVWSGVGSFLRARSLFFSDPEGNTIELIAHDPSVT
ncbi:MAG: VOC family protein [Chloroflexi bacterium]|nr:VOC family protein [Chloroflexota bacterium]